MKCDTCKDQGTYYDRRCLQKICDHLGTITENGEREPIMECPIRACLCKAGKEARLILQERAHQQNQQLEEWAEAYKEADRGKQYDQLFLVEDEEKEEPSTVQPSTNSTK